VLGRVATHTPSVSERCCGCRACVGEECSSTLTLCCNQGRDLMIAHVRDDDCSMVIIMCSIVHATLLLMHGTIHPDMTVQFA
jgi:hypothetical protein